MALCIWGKPAAGGAYAAIAALTNIPATMIGALIYEFILTDSARGAFFFSSRGDVVSGS